jgi:hypothetical protein
MPKKIVIMLKGHQSIGSANEALGKFQLAEFEAWNFEDGSETDREKG